MAGINALISRLERFAAQEVQERIAEHVRRAVHDECLAGFIEQRDPYGTPWTRRIDKRGTWPLLQKTGRGVESIRSSASGGRVSIRIIGYMKFHQGGTSRMVARKFFPDPERGLGNWAEPIRRASLEAVTELAR